MHPSSRSSLQVLLDGAHLRPQYSLRTLCRALSIAKTLFRMRHALLAGLYEVRTPSVWWGGGTGSRQRPSACFIIFSPPHVPDVNSFCCHGLVYLLDSW